MLVEWLYLPFAERNIAILLRKPSPLKSEHRAGEKGLQKTPAYAVASNAIKRLRRILCFSLEIQLPSTKTISSYDDQVNTFLFPWSWQEFQPWKDSGIFPGTIPRP
jgi:hypothetical protein